MISKELLSEVLGEDRATSCNKLEMEIGNNFLIVDDWIKINIYELAHKCKEWAYSTYGIMIQSYPYCGKGRADAIKGLKVDEVFKEKTEPEAIFKAAQWVLDNTSTNKLKGH